MLLFYKLHFWFIKNGIEKQSYIAHNYKLKIVIYKSETCFIIYYNKSGLGSINHGSCL